MPGYEKISRIIMSIAYIIIMSANLTLKKVLVSTMSVSFQALCDHILKDSCMFVQEFLIFDNLFAYYLSKYRVFLVIFMLNLLQKSKSQFIPKSLNLYYLEKKERQEANKQKTKNKISTIPKCISNNKLFAYFSKSILINFKGCYKSKK